MKAFSRFLCVLSWTAFCVACGGGGGGVAATPALPAPPVSGAPSVTVNVGIKQLIFSWAAVSGSTHYRLLENADGSSGFTQVGADISAGTLSVSLPIAVHFQDFARALYIVQACDATGCTNSSEVNAMNGMLSAIGYFKASNTGLRDFFGFAVALSADGNTLAVGATQEESNATGINGNQNDNSKFAAGAVYVFRFNGMNWLQQAYVKASNTDFSEWFGTAVSLSTDGNTLAVGAGSESSGATGINGDQNNNLAIVSGAAYVFRFDGTDWFQQAYVKASNTDGGDRFGDAVSLSADGNTLAVGAGGEDSNATGIDGDQNNNSASGSGAVYVFRFDGAAWSQQAYVKASNAEADDRFGLPVSLSADGNTLAAGAGGEDSIATGINGNQNDNSASASGAAYVFRFDGAAWAQQAYVKASNTGLTDFFGGALALSADGNTLAVGADEEDSNATGIDGNQNDNSALGSGAAYVFRFDGTDWTQQAYVKASNSGWNDVFGEAVSLSADGNTLAVGASGEDSNATGINGTQYDDSFGFTGAAYVFRFDGMNWLQQAYVKASNSGNGDGFGWAVALSADGNALAVGAIGEESNATGINGNQNDDSAEASGAVYVY